jgi:hypothetical protein
MPVFKHSASRPFVVTVVGLIGLVAAPCLGARQAATLPRLPDIASAEADGARHPPGDLRITQPFLDRDLAGSYGTARRTCVEVGDHDVALAGDFLAGSFRLLRANWRPGGLRKFWWRPRFLADARARFLDDGWLTIRATRLDTPGTYTEDTADHIAFGAGFGFFNTAFGLPEAGRWMLVASYEGNWGCFLVGGP